MSTVSWQSAFWGLVPLAINSMVQPAGVFMERMTPLTCSLLRLSPVFCLCDAITSALQVLRYSRRHRMGWAMACKAWSQTRCTSGDAGLESHPVWRLVVFLIAAIQSVKLFASSGIPWTQVVAGAYLASFVILELLIRLGASVQFKQGTLLPPFSAPRQPLFFYPNESATVQVELLDAFCLFSSPVFFTIALPCFVTGSWTNTIPGWLLQFVFAFPWHLLSMPLSVLLSMPYLVSRIWTDKEWLYDVITWWWWQQPRVAPIIWYLTVPVFLCYLMCSPPRVDLGPLNKALRGMGGFVGWRWKDDESLLSDGERERAAIVLHAHVVSSLYLFLGTMLLYATRFHSDGSFKPAWTENLG